MWRRWAFRIAAGVSLLLCAAAGVLWASGGSAVVRARDGYWTRPGDHHAYYLGVRSYAGTLSVEFNHRYFPASYLRQFDERERRDFDLMYPSHPKVIAAWGRQTLFYSPGPVGFHGQHGVYPQAGGWRSDYWMAAVPFWVPMGVLMVMPALWARRWWVIRRRRRLGLCAQCGYDLRATPGQCPECGKGMERTVTGA